MKRKKVWLSIGINLFITSLLLVAGLHYMETAVAANTPTCAISLNDHVTTDYSGSTAAPLQQAVVDAQSGDLLKVAGVCEGVQTVSGETQTVYISKSLTLVGGYDFNDWTKTPDPNKNPTILDARGNGRVVYIPSGVTVTLHNLVIQDGYTARNGAGISSQAILTVSNTILQNNWALRNGGGLSSSSSGQTVITASQFIRNIGDSGGGLYTNRPITIVNSAINDNLVREYGAGAMLEYAPHFSLSNSEVLRNTNTDFEGGGLYIYDTRGTIQASRIINNVALGSAGGGVHIEGDAVVTLLDSEVAYNHADFGGGGISLDDNVAIDIQTSSIHNNTSATSGGGINASASVVTATQTTIANNRAVTDGGGVSVEGRGATAILRNSTVTHNQADFGGGLYGEPRNGGSQPGSVLISITHTTIYSNVAGSEGGGIYLFDSVDGNAHIVEARMQNSIVAGNSPTDCRAAHAYEVWDSSAGYNLDADGSCVEHGGVGNLTAVSHLGYLTDNGGVTQTHLPQLTSPAIDQIPLENCPFLQDQRGVSRPIGSACDIGAVEVELFTYLPIISKLEE